MIPARWGSSRLPGKPLADVGGVPLVERVRRQCVQARDIARVLVATDDARIADVVRQSGGDAVHTGPAPSGTHRVWEAVREAGPMHVINVQGDLPLIPPRAVEAVGAVLRSGASIATLAAPWPVDVPRSDRAVVKVQTDAEGRAAQFSRGEVPGWRHIGIYGFRFEALARAVACPRTARTREEDLEQIAWLEGGLHIHVAVVPGVGPAIDTPAQLQEVRRQLARDDPGSPAAVGAPHSH